MNYRSIILFSLWLLGLLMPTFLWILLLTIDALFPRLNFKIDWFRTAQVILPPLMVWTAINLSRYTLLEKFSLLLISAVFLGIGYFIGFIVSIAITGLPVD